MQASTVDTPTAGHCGTIFVAIELSQKTWLVTLHSPDRDRISRRTLEGGDDAGLLALLEGVRTRVVGKLGTVPRVVTCYEAGYDGFWLHRLLTAAGITNLVFDPASIAVEQRSRRAKTDRIDGEHLLRTLMAHLRGEPRVVRIVRVPSVEQEDVRRASRERDRLVKEQTGHTNRIKALLRLMGMAVSNPRRSDWLSWLAQQRDRQSRPVPPHLMSEVTREHARLMLVREQLATLEQAPTAAVAAAAAPMAERRNLLLRLKGLGPVFATTLTNEAFYKDSALLGPPAASPSMRLQPGAAAASIANRGSARQATPVLASRRSSSPGCGCGISRTARSAGGLPRAPPTRVNGPGASPSLP